MYTMFNHSHQGLALLSLLLTLGWAVMVMVAPRTTTTLGRAQRLCYIGTMAATGLVGVTGLLLGLLQGSWMTMLFPWLGLAAVIGHGIAGVRSRKALTAGQKSAAVIAVVVQVLLLVASYGLMTVKPF